MFRLPLPRFVRALRDFCLRQPYKGGLFASEFPDHAQARLGPPPQFALVRRAYPRLHRKARRDVLMKLRHDEQLAPGAALEVEFDTQGRGGRCVVERGVVEQRPASATFGKVTSPVPAMAIMLQRALKR